MFFLKLWRIRSYDSMILSYDLTQQIKKLNNNTLKNFKKNMVFRKAQISDKILNELELEAQKNNSKIITSDISITAKPFFEKKGFNAITEQKNIRQNVELINYKMEKIL